MAIYIGNQKVSVKGGLEVSGFTIPVFTGSFNSRFARNNWNWFIEEYGDKIITQDITDCTQAFYASNTLTKIPFEINCRSVGSVACSSMFSDCTKLTSVPKINNCTVNSMNSMFLNCYCLRELPEDIDSWFNWSYFDSSNSSSSNSMFKSCTSLRRIPMSFLNHGYPSSSYSYAFYREGFYVCQCLDELVGLPCPYTNATWGSNAFSSAFTQCYRLKNIIFATPNGQPYVVKWKNQQISLVSYVGYASAMNNTITTYNSGITEETRITDETTYQLYKNHPDSWTTDIAYSRYNHDSAVATINSLPDTSAYLASAGGTNTITFKGASGSLTDGGAINTLTEEEIAVATAKGWTVTFS